MTNDDTTDDDRGAGDRRNGNGERRDDVGKRHANVDGRHDARGVSGPNTDPRDDMRTRAERLRDSRFNRTIESLLDVYEKIGFATMIASWTLAAVHDQLDAPPRGPVALIAFGLVALAIPTFTRGPLWRRFKRPGE